MGIYRPLDGGFAADEPPNNSSRVTAGWSSVMVLGHYYNTISVIACALHLSSAYKHFWRNVRMISGATVLERITKTIKAVYGNKLLGRCLYPKEQAALYSHAGGVHCTSAPQACQDRQGHGHPAGTTLSPVHR